jgi:hypothetical protein
MDPQQMLTSAKQSTARFFRRLFIGIIVLIVLAIGFTFIAFNLSYSKGERAGTISKFSEKGYVFKTFEGELNVGGFSGNTGNLVPQIWAFSVEGSNAEIAKIIEDAMATGNRVRVKYEQKYFTLPWKGETEYFVTEVEAVK